MNTNTQTPRTDAAEQRDITGLGVVPVDFARKLERELADYRARTKEIIDEDHQRILALIHERDTYKARAEERRALRVEIEQALGMESKPGDTSDDALKQGLATIAALRADLARVTAERDEAVTKAILDDLDLAGERAALRARVAELEERANRYEGWLREVAVQRDELKQRVAELVAAADKEEQHRKGNVRLMARVYELEQRNAELVAALRAIRDLDDDATAEDCAARAGSALASAESATPAKQSPEIDAEALIAACIPGGSICDPQQVADAIREYLRQQEPCGGQCGDPDCDLDTTGVTMRAPAPHADTVRLDWFAANFCGASNSERYLPFRMYWGGGQAKTLREKIDAAMEGSRHD